MRNHSTLTTQLRNDHAELERLAREFRGILAEGAPPNGIELVNFRQNFSRQILAHLHLEDMLLYPRLLKSVDPFVSTMAQAFLDEMGGLLDAYKAWVLRWPTERATSEWIKFREETDALLNALDRRIANENEKLYPLVEGSAYLAGTPERSAC